MQTISIRPAILAQPACESTLDDGSALRFVNNGDGTFRDEATQSTWNAFGEAIAGELEGSQLRWINAFPHFWFAWAAHYAQTRLVTGPT